MNWLATLIVSVIGSIILSIAGNLLTDRYKDWTAKRSVINSRKRLNTLKKELQRVASLNDDRPRFYLEFGRALISILSFFSFGIGAGITGTASYLIATHPAYGNPSLYLIITLIAIVFGALMFIVGIIISLDCLTLLAKILDYPNYKTITEKRITELSKTKETPVTQS
jgi:hypothetical protein